MTNPRNVAASDGADFGRKTFDRGVSAVIAVVFGNKALGECGISTGGGLTDDDLEALRWLRQKVHGRKSYGYEPRRKRPARNGLRGLRHHTRATAERTP